MGNSVQNSSILGKNEGYRVLQIRKNSPLDNQLQPYFDFIIDISPQSPIQRSPKDILNKLSSSPQQPKKSLLQKIKQYQNIPVLFKIISTKLRNIRTVRGIPNKTWNGTQDILGLKLRKQRYDQVFDTYYPITNICNNSPIKKAGIVDGQYLIGCQQFQYKSLNQLMDSLYDKFFDKEIKDKNINFAIYNIIQDHLRIVTIQMKRGWGGQGLLGCQFSQGYLYKFPLHFHQYRQEILAKQKLKQKNIKIRQQLKQCDGASKQLVQALKLNRNKNKNHLKDIYSLLSISPPIIPPRQNKSNIENNHKNIQNQYQNWQRVSILESRVTHLEQTLNSIKQYLEKVQQPEQYPQQQI